jgi:hypothetical protein
MTIDLNVRMTRRHLKEFVGFIEDLNEQIGFKISSRGWGYILEQRGLITKDQFDKVEGAINRCRREGLLPVDFVAEEASRAFSNVEEPTTSSPAEHVRGWVEAALESHQFFTPDWWEGEEVYIQMVVEKIDLVTLFGPICARFHIPIANAKGWSSILQRAEYCRRFAEAEARGLRCVLLYCGDHDPDGLRISETLRKNLEDISQIRWADGFAGYDPSALEIHRFGLEYDFIQRNGLTWIDNLITGSGKDLGDRGHPNHELQYVQGYLSRVGRRKCEANSVVVIPKMGRELCERTILKFLGGDARQRFEKKTNRAQELIEEALSESRAGESIEQALKRLRKYERSL